MNFCRFFLAVFLFLFRFCAFASGENFQGVASRCSQQTKSSIFLQAFVNKDGEFQDSKTAADVLTVASQGIDSLDTYYSYYSLNLRTYLNCLDSVGDCVFLFPTGGLIFILRSKCLSFMQSTRD